MTQQQQLQPASFTSAPTLLYADINQISAVPSLVYTDIASSTTLNLNDSITFDLYFDIQLSGSRLEECYGKYGDVWKWSTFTSKQRINPELPYTWQDVSAKGIYPKKWRTEQIDPDHMIRRSPIMCTVTGLAWITSTQNWSYTVTSNFQTNSSITFDQVRDYRLTITATQSGIDPLTIGVNEDTIITVQSVAEVLIYNDPSYPRLLDVVIDAVTAQRTFTHTITTIIYQYPDVILYTTTPFLERVLTLKAVSYILYPERLVRAVFDFGEGNIYDIDNIDVNGISSVPTEFFVTYKSVGSKNVSVSAFIYSHLSTEPRVWSFDNFVKIVDVYDIVDVDLYSLHTLEFNVPHSEIIMYPNEVGTSVVFNSVLLQLQDNIDYLKRLSLYYVDTEFKFLGWYGPTDTTSLTPNRVISDYDGDYITSENYEFINWEEAERSYFTDDLPTITAYNTTSTYAFGGLSSLDSTITDVLNTSQLTGTSVCVERSRWHLPTQGLSDYFDKVPRHPADSSCLLNDIFIVDELMFTATSTQVRVQRLNIKGAAVAPYVCGLTKDVLFSHITAIAPGLNNSIYVCDRDNSAITSLIFKPNNIQKWEQGFIFTGIGTENSRYKFNRPNDICTDSNANLYVCDTGNKCIKIFNGRGDWLHTLFLNDTPISITIDSRNRIHILILTKVLVYDITDFSYLYSYTYKNINQPLRIRSNFNKEIIYICSDNELYKHFRTGQVYSLLQLGRSSMRNIHQDKNRNLYVLKNDIILKYTDNMVLYDRVNNSLFKYWSRDDLSIKQNEYVQDWVYSRAFQRMWDNIELFRNTIKYKYSKTCGNLVLPTFKKDEVYIAQNEIVTSSVLNRCLGYLHENLVTLYSYYNGSCE